MKIQLTREHKAVLLQALLDGFVYESDLNTIKGTPIFVSDKPMSRKDYLKLLNELKGRDYYDEDEQDNTK
jgi:hypothetical protein